MRAASFLLMLNIFCFERFFYSPNPGARGSYVPIGPAISQGASYFVVFDVGPTIGILVLFRRLNLPVGERLFLLDPRDPGEP